MPIIAIRAVLLVVLLWCSFGCVSDVSTDASAMATPDRAAHCHDVTQWEAANEFASCLCDDDLHGYPDAASCEDGIVGGFCSDEADCSAVLPQEMLDLYASCREQACDDGLLAPSCWTLFQF